MKKIEKGKVYRHLKTGDIWARPKEMFYEKMDKNKYPDVSQEYRFEEYNE